MDLQVVRLLRDAIRTADLAGGRVEPAALAAFRSRAVVHPEPRFEPRPVVHPTPRFEPRPVLHPRPRVEFEMQTPPAEAGRTEGCDCPHSVERSLPAPWSEPWWEKPVTPAPKVKLYIHRTDLMNKGSLLDFFI
jgi:hypothetical protein